MKPRPEPKEQALPPTLAGPIGSRWRALGAWRGGQPTSDGEPLPGGKAVVVVRPDRQFATILWRSSTGALLVAPTMAGPYLRQRGAGGPLGFPTAEERATHDGVGRFQTDGVPFRGVGDHVRSRKLLVRFGVLRARRRRSVTDDEVRLLDLVFAGTIDRRQITLTDTAGKGGRAFALGLTSAAAMTDPVFAYAIANIKAGRV